MLTLFEEMNLPSNDDFVDSIVAEYEKEKEAISFLSGIFSDKKYKRAIEFFHKYEYRVKNGAEGESMDYAKPDGAIRVLNAELWNKALLHTDVHDFMPAKRRAEWNDQISSLNTLEICQDAMRTTLNELMQSRAKFFSERVDGVFQSLSRSHVTNQPQGFSKRMIINGVINQWGMTEYRKVAYIHDLRCIIAKFMGRDDPSNDTADMVDWVKQENGKWQSVDSGAFRMRVYNGVGTVHIEVHPDMAWRLNAVLASLYPAAIPDAARVKPARKTVIKDFELMEKPLPFKVLQAIGGIEQDYKLNGQWGNYTKTVTENIYKVGLSEDKHLNIAVADVLKHIGGIEQERGKWFFDYNPLRTCKRIQHEGSMPEYKSHQYYPTPDIIAEKVAELVGDSGSLLEPSAGIGSLLKMLSGGATVVEINAIHCEVLKAKGYTPNRADFMRWDSGNKYERIVMNPPYSQGRWQAHTKRAANMLTHDGVLVAVVPVSAVGAFKIDGFKIDFCERFNNSFDGAGVDVVIMRITR